MVLSGKWAGGDFKLVLFGLFSALELTIVCGCDQVGGVQLDIKITDTETNTPIADACVLIAQVSDPDHLVFEEHGRTDEEGQIAAVITVIVDPATGAPAFDETIIVKVDDKTMTESFDLPLETGASSSGDRFHLNIKAVTPNVEFPVRSSCALEAP